MRNIFALRNQDKACKKLKREFDCPKCHQHYENATPILTVGGIMCFNCWKKTK